MVVFFFVRKHKFWIKLLFTIGQSTTMAIRRHNQYVPCSPRTFLHQSTKLQTETHQTRSVKLLRDTILYFTASPARRYILPLLWLKDLKETLLRCEPFRAWCLVWWCSFNGGTVHGTPTCCCCKQNNRRKRPKKPRVSALFHIQSHLLSIWFICTKPAKRLAPFRSLRKSSDKTNSQKLKTLVVCARELHQRGEKAAREISFVENTHRI